jgi:hypothetical protein
MRLLLLSVLSVFCLQSSATASDAFPSPMSPNQLIANFVRAINERNINEYERVLHPEFIFGFAPDHRSLLSTPSNAGFTFSRTSNRGHGPTIRLSS